RASRETLRRGHLGAVSGRTALSHRRAGGSVLPQSKSNPLRDTYGLFRRSDARRGARACGSAGLSKRWLLRDDAGRLPLKRETSIHAFRAYRFRDGQGNAMITAALQRQTQASAAEPMQMDLDASVRALGAEFRPRAASPETTATVPIESVEALRALGFFKLVQPQAYRGYEEDFEHLVGLTIEIGRWCASTAWVCGLLAAHQWLVAGFPAEAQHDVWDQNPDALICGSYAPATRALAVAGGYKLTGRWSFASGCDNSHWAVCAALLPPPADGNTLIPAFLLVPANDYRIDDTWHVTGLAGTGSKTLVLDDVFVPKHRVLTFEQTTSGQTPGSQLYARNPCFSIP